MNFDFELISIIWSLPFIKYFDKVKIIPKIVGKNMLRNKDSDLAHFIWRWNQSERLSEV